MCCNFKLQLEKANSQQATTWSRKCARCVVDGRSRLLILLELFVCRKQTRQEFIRGYWSTYLHLSLNRAVATTRDLDPWIATLIIIGTVQPVIHTNSNSNSYEMRSFTSLLYTSIAVVSYFGLYIFGLTILTDVISILLFALLKITMNVKIFCGKYVYFMPKLIFKHFSVTKRRNI